MNKAATNPVFITEELLVNININDPFFDSFKTQYINFTHWFHYLAKSGKKAWIYMDNEAVAAFLLIEEDEYISGASPEYERKKRLNISRLKICTQVMIITELFLKITIDEAIKKSINEIYFTCFPGQQENIIPFLTEIGFEKLARKTNNEDIYIKKLCPPSRNMEPAEIQERYYPTFYDGIKVKKYILPVPPLLHNKIFADSREFKPTLFESAGEKFIEGNTIKKLIFLKDKTALSLVKGDILLIYRTTDIKSLTSLCVVDHVNINKKQDTELPALYHEEEQESRAEKTGVYFKWYFHLPVYIDNAFLNSLKISSRNLNKIIRLDQKKYKTIIQECRLNPEYIVP